MTDKVIKYVKEHEMLEKGDLVVAGVSGGADSVCLLFVLLEIRKEIPIEIHVVHVNHMIREDASLDAQYVETLCKSNGIRFTLVEKDVEAIAKAKHLSTEEAGRNVRYEAFYRELGNRKGKIAIAHNKNDCCETFLFNLFRGSSLRGLVGIRPVRNEVIRPLLCVQRSEIELYLKKRNIHYCVDSTNLSDDYTRNKIRHHILDRASSDICENSIGNIGNACERIGEAYGLIADMTQTAFDECVTEVDNKMYKKAYHIDYDGYEKIHNSIKGYVIMETLSKTSGKSKDLEAVHVNDVKSLFDKRTGSKINLPYKMTAVRDYSGVFVYIEEALPTKPVEMVVTKDELTALSEGEKLVKTLKNGERFTFEVMYNYEKNLNLENIPQKKYTKWLDYDKIIGSIVIRTRRNGDYICVNSLNQKKKLKAYFIDEKIPALERDRTILLADESHIMWVVGARISNYYKVADDTVRVLCVTKEV